LFSVKKLLGLASAAGILGAVGLAGLTAPALAAPAPAARTGMVAVGTAALPNTNIQGAPAKWSPTKLSVTPKNFTTCTAAKVVWTITNKTAKAQTISFKVGSGAKHPLGTVAAKTKAGVCSRGAKGTVETFFIKGSASTMKLTLK